MTASLAQGNPDCNYVTSDDVLKDGFHKSLQLKHTEGQDKILACVIQVPQELSLNGKKRKSLFFQSVIRSINICKFWIYIVCTYLFVAALATAAERKYLTPCPSSAENIVSSHGTLGENLRLFTSRKSILYSLPLIQTSP